jgi:SAM-dependent methyltransferase
MQPADNYIEINKALWNERTGIHVDSEFYNMEGFLEGETSLKEIELALVNDLPGKTLLHLQCHFGQDTLSLARIGAKVTGVDFSENAINTAVDLAQKLKIDSTFICCDIYDLPKHLDQQFDIIFTTYGTVGWLPDLGKWASLINKFLKPGGEFIFAEFHPVVWMFDNNIKYPQYFYFNKEAIVEMEKGSYTDAEAPIEMQSVGWNHSLDEVIGNLLGVGLTLHEFHEFDFSPYSFLHNSVEVAPGRYQIKGLEGKLPLVYSLRMSKPA